MNVLHGIHIASIFLVIWNGNQVSNLQWNNQRYILYIIAEARLKNCTKPQEALYLNIRFWLYKPDNTLEPISKEYKNFA